MKTLLYIKCWIRIDQRSSPCFPAKSVVRIKKKISEKKKLTLARRAELWERGARKISARQVSINFFWLIFVVVVVVVIIIIEIRKKERSFSLSRVEFVHNKYNLELVSKHLSNNSVLTLAAFSGTSASYEEGENSAGRSSASSMRIFSVVLELSPLPGPLS